MKRIGLRTRFIVLISLILLVTFALIAYFLINNARVSLTNYLNRESKAFAILATKPIGNTYSIYQASGSLLIKQEVQTFLDLDNNITNVGVIDLSGQTIFNQNSKLGFTNTQSNNASFDPIYTTNKNRLVTQIQVPYINDAGQHPFSILYTISSKQLTQDTKSEVIDILLFSILGLLATIFTLYELINEFFLRPIEIVSRTALTISQGKYQQQIASGRQDEIGDLITSVNKMASSLEADITKLQELDRLKNEFIMITSHNLRTPLSIIAGNVDILQDTELNDQAHEMIDAIHQSALRLGDFSEDMLTIASLESGSASLDVKDITTDELIKKIRNEFDLLAKERQISLAWDIFDLNAVVRVSSQHIAGAIRKLLNNAIKFTSQGGRVKLTMTRDKNDLVIEVDDNGIGISQDEIPKLFTKFHRGTDILEYNYEGTGIGLYMAKLVVETYGGNLSVKSQLGKGSVFTIRLPQSETKKSVT